jgi:hypothetical protein
MVTATEEVWNPFLVSHPAARKFKNTPFPEFHELTVIFGGNSANGALRRSSETTAIQQHKELLPDKPNGNSMDERAQSTQTPGARPPC